MEVVWRLGPVLINITGPKLCDPANASHSIKVNIQDSCLNNLSRGGGSGFKIPPPRFF